MAVDDYQSYSATLLQPTGQGCFEAGHADCTQETGDNPNPQEYLGGPHCPDYVDVFTDCAWDDPLYSWEYRLAGWNGPTMIDLASPIYLPFKNNSWPTIRVDGKVYAHIDDTTKSDVIPNHHFNTDNWYGDRGTASYSVQQDAPDDIKANQGADPVFGATLQSRQLVWGDFYSRASGGNCSKCIKLNFIAPWQGVLRMWQASGGTLGDARAWKVDGAGNEIPGTAIRADRNYANSEGVSVYMVFNPGDHVMLRTQGYGETWWYYTPAVYTGVEGSI